MIVPQMTELPWAWTIAFLGIASVANAIVPALFVARLRHELSLSQERELLQDWKLRRMRDDFLRVKSQPT